MKRMQHADYLLTRCARLESYMQASVVRCSNHFHTPVPIQVRCNGRRQDISVLKRSSVLINLVIPAQFTRS